MTSDQGEQTIFCFGEILWDCLPAGLFLGGAPINVAYHLKRHGKSVVPITAIGNDFLGREAVRRLENWNVDIDGVGFSEKSTGVVIAQIDSHGNASYNIVEDVAWDEISLSSALDSDVKNASAIVFGSLALRSSNNQLVLKSILQKANDALKVFDVNLRPPYDNLVLVKEMAQIADLVKLNHEEASVLVGGKSSDYEVNARKIADETDTPTVCITAGGNGAGLFKDGQWFWESAKPVEVKDTVGAGDSFLASLLSGLIDGDQSPKQLLRAACRLAEFVASCHGAQPQYEPKNLVS
ncbi:MAG: carbohydrate kinase [Verrucomicrobiota bacterium]